MAITTYTSYAEVRAALGVSSDELPDAQLGYDMYDTGLLFELESIDAGLPAAYAVVAAKLVGARTAAEQRFYLTTRQFAVYATAVQLIPALPLIAAKTITDGKASITRDAAAPFKLTIEECRRKFSALSQALTDAYKGYGGSAAVAASPLPYMLAGAPSTDPVVDQS